MTFIPGQFIEISLPGYGEGPVAPCSDPKDKKHIEIVVRDVGSLTHAVNQLVEGDKIFVRGPYGNGWPMRKLYHRDLVIMSGGMGIIPLRPLLFSALEKPHMFGKVYLLLGAKDQRSHLFRDDFTTWKKKFYYFKTIVDKADPEYKGLVGVVTDLLKPLNIKGNRASGLVCGPEVMCPFCVEAMEHKSIDKNNIFASLERRMKCGIGLCQHCSCGQYLVCKDGPVFSWNEIKEEMEK